MNKQSLVSVAAGIVLIAGLTSCKQNKSITPDIYNPPAPQFVGATGELKTADGRIDLEDSVDARPAAPAIVEVRGSCTQALVSTPIKAHFEGESKISLLRILPESYLSTNLEQVPATCVFIFRLRNALGSWHHFDPVSLSLQERLRPQVNLGFDNDSPLPPVLHTSKLTGIRIRFTPSRPARASLSCEEFTLGPLNFENVLDLDHFDFSRRQNRFKHDPKPMENCRVLISEDGQVSAVSIRFRLVVPYKAIQISEPSQTYSPLVARQEQGIAADRCNRTPYKIGQITLINTEDHVRFLRRNQRQLLVAEFWVGNRIAGPLIPALPMLEVRGIPPLEGLMKADENSSLWRVGSGAHLQFDLFRHPVQADCTREKFPFELDKLYQITEPLVIEETDENGEAFDRFEFQLHQCFVSTFQPVTVGPSLDAFKAVAVPGCI